MTLHDHGLDAGTLTLAEKREIIAAMCGLDWHVESHGVENNLRRTDHGVRTTAWTVYVMNHLDHLYEVAQWSHGRIYRTAEVRLLSGGTFTCSCASSKAYRARRGHCNHINRLTMHAVRRLPTLPAPAGEIARTYAARWAV